jgi:sugar (pentulose or hexulose) kinase
MAEQSGRGDDLVVGLDASTTATKAIAWSPEGKSVAEGRAPCRMFSPKPNYYEQDPADWWRAACDALRQMTASIEPARIVAISISNQRETFAPFDAEGKPVRMGMVWLDERARHLVDELASMLGSDAGGVARIHQISGKPVDVIPVSNRIYWMLKEEPELHARAAMFADVHGFLVHKLTGRYATSWASADPLGLFDNAAKCWSAEILAAIGIDATRLPVAERPGSVLGQVSPQAAALTGLKAGTPVVAGGGDGQLAGLGAGALSPDTAYLNIGTALVSGVHGKAYRNSSAWRTMGSPTGEGYYYESCLRGGTFTVSWFLETICAGEVGSNAEKLSGLEQQAAEIPPGSNGLLMLPYWQGVMSPYWDSAARGAFLGLSGAHGRGHMYRALMEGMAFEQDLCTRAVEDELGISVARFIGIGGGAASNVWRQIFADVTGKAVARSATDEASSLGAAMCAAVGARWYDGYSSAVKAMAGRIIAVSQPRPASHDHYQRLFEVYRQIYPALKPLYRAIDQLPEIVR